MKAIADPALIALQTATLNLIARVEYVMAQTAKVAA